MPLPEKTTILQTLDAPRDRFAGLRSLALMLRFALLGWFGRRPLVDPEGPVVSLTSYGARIRFVHLAIESIGRGSLRPSRLLLWLDDRDVVRRPPRSLRRLQRRGLEILLCDDFGPYKKSFPFALTSTHHVAPLVTADDDWLVPAGWLETLVDTATRHPDTVLAHRAHEIRVEKGRIAPYATWTRADSPTVSFRHFGTGCMGQLLPPAVLDALREEGVRFPTFAPHADDVWIHRLAVSTGSGVRPVGLLLDDDFAPIRGAGRLGGAGLFEENVAGGRNDRQIAAAYTPSELAAILAAPPVLSP